MNEILDVVGKRVPQVNADLLVTGNARYISDTVLPRMLIGKLLRSPHAHARILSIDTSAAEEMPGVKAVVTAADTPMIKYSFQAKYSRKLPLEAEKVRYIGDEVAAVAAVDEETALRAVDAIKVEYEVLPAVFDPEEAMKPGAPRLHDEDENNVIATLLCRDFGNVEKAFEECDFVFDDRYRTQAQAHVCMETRSVVASYDKKGKLTLYASTQFPHVLRDIISRVLDIPESKIRVIKTFMGGGFGARQSIDPINPISAVLAKKSGYPVLIRKTREEEFETDRTRHPMIIDIKTGVSKDGAIIARHMRVISDTGAYHDQAVAVTASAANKISNFYQSQHVRIEGKVVLTNKVFGGAFRGYGNPQATFAIESQMDKIAEAIGMDRVEFRMKNVNKQGETTVAGAKLVHCEFGACIDEAVKASNWDKSGSTATRRRGTGMGCFIHTGGGARTAHANSFSSTFIKVNGDGAIDLFTGTPDVGQGSDSVFAQIAAEELGIAYENVNVVSADTDLTPSTLGVRGSRETFMQGNATKNAAANIKRQVLERASEMMQVNVDEVDMKKGVVFVKADPDRFISLPEVMAPSSPELASSFPMPMSIVGTGEFVDDISELADPKSGYGNTCPTWAFGAQVAEIEVDIETGHIDVLKISGAYDIGRAINPMAVEGQMEGGTAQGLGYALFEDVQWKDGRVENANLADYKVATPMDMPPMETILIETGDPYGPYGAKGVGEAGMIPTAAAINNALYDAIGVRLIEIPLTPERVLAAIWEQGITPLPGETAAGE